MRIALCIALLALSGCSLRDGLQRHEAALYAATAADLGTTQVGLERGFREANPLLRPIVDEGGIGALIVFQIALNEFALWREQRACDPQRIGHYTITDQCLRARQARNSIIAAHSFGAAWNAASLWSAQ